MTGEQIRAARAMLGISAGELAQIAGVSAPTMQRMDSANGEVGGRYQTVTAVRSALEAKGITFLEDGQAARGDGISLSVEAS